MQNRMVKTIKNILIETTILDENNGFLNLIPSNKEHPRNINYFNLILAAVDHNENTCIRKALIYTKKTMSYSYYNTFSIVNHV